MMQTDMEAGRGNKRIQSNRDSETDAAELPVHCVNSTKHVETCHYLLNGVTTCGDLIIPAEMYPYLPKGVSTC